jgi:hypothetical protein
MSYQDADFVIINNDEDDDDEDDDADYPFDWSASKNAATNVDNYIAQQTNSKSKSPYAHTQLNIHVGDDSGWTEISSGDSNDSSKRIGDIFAAVATGVDIFGTEAQSADTNFSDFFGNSSSNAVLEPDETANNDFFSGFNNLAINSPASPSTGEDFFAQGIVSSGSSVGSNSPIGDNTFSFASFPTAVGASSDSPNKSSEGTFLFI